VPRPRTLLVFAAALGVCPGFPPAPPAFGAAAEAEAAPTQLNALADQGRFVDLLGALKAHAPADHPDATRSLIRSLERYQLNQEQREQARQTAYREALDEVAEKLKEDDLEEAMVSAIEAHSIAEEPMLVLEHPAVKDLVKRTEIAAKKAELAEDWVESSVLFGRLNLLFEDGKAYRDDIKRIGSHLRVLAIYHPDVLRELQRARAERIGRLEEFDRAQPDDESWQDRLAGIDTEMLKESIKTATVQHIDHDGYSQLLAGAIEPLLILTETPALAEIFPGLGDEAKVEAFRSALLRSRAALEKPGLELTEYQAMSRLDQMLIENRKSVNLPEPVIAYEMTEGALATLDDFSSMYWPEDIDFLSRSTQGAFTGIGVQIARRNEQLTVVSPLNGTPAQKAGLKAGDIIATVNGKDTSSWSLNKAVREITGPSGTLVRLMILRADEPELLPFDIERGRIEIESVKGWDHRKDGSWDYWIDKTAGLGYIRLTQFIPQSVDRIDQAVAEMQREGQLNGLILDLRHNPGGLLTSAINIVDRFLDSGPVLFTVDGERRVRNAWSAKSRRTYPDFEVIVLINRGSASASEIVSGALQDRGRAFIIGDRSYGKGSVQDVYWFPSAPPRAKYGLKVTTQYYQLPNGRIIHRKPDSTVWGIDPDLVVDVTDQTVAWNLELRQEIDVLRDRNVETIEAERTKPWVRLAGLEPLDADDEAAKEKVQVPLPTPRDLINLGLDPQLESALLVLKTRQIADDIAVAQGR
jgi:carboxyl-terminal processing protease